MIGENPVTAHAVASEAVIDSRSGGARTVGEHAMTAHAVASGGVPSDAQWTCLLIFLPLPCRFVALTKTAALLLRHPTLHRSYSRCESRIILENDGESVTYHGTLSLHYGC